MNFKQKLVYMFIGSLFTLAGYFLATLANNQPPNAHAQDNTTKVFDKIVCKELEVVNQDGKRAVCIITDKSGGVIYIDNNEGKMVSSIGTDHNSNGHLMINNKEGIGFAHFKILDSGGVMFIYDKKESRNVAIGTRKLSGFIVLNNTTSAEERPAVQLDGLTGGRLLLHNKNETHRVYIGSIKDRPNDGVINIYDFKGDHRSYTAD